MEIWCVLLSAILPLIMKRIVILHLGNYLLTADSGVAQKTFALADSMRRIGVDVHCVAFPFLYSGSYNSTADVEVVFETDARVYQAILQYFRTKIRPDELVLFRYPFASAPLLDIMHEFGHQIVFEHNSVESAEVLMLQKSHFSRFPFSWTPSYLRYAIKTHLLQQTDETRYGSRVLRQALGGICVSREIAQYEVGRCHSYQTTVIANGVRLPISAHTIAPPFSTNLRVCMIIGSPAVWHGYDRMFEGLQQFKSSEYTVSVDIIGMQKPEKAMPTEIGQHRINWLGIMKREEIAHHLRHCHMAVGTLALFRKKMKEASPLKVRECLMLGMPMILGYEDTDVSADSRFSPYILQVPNTNDPINWSRVIEFYKVLAASANHRREIATLSEEVLAMEKKAEQYVAFMRSRFNDSKVK
jgi:hypothetical protein